MGLKLRREEENVTVATRRFLVNIYIHKPKTLCSEACSSRTCSHVYKVLQLQSVHHCLQPIPVAERYKTRVCVRSLTGFASSNPVGGMDVCVVCVVQQG
jgi:hypothetical protein